MNSSRISVGAVLTGLASVALLAGVAAAGGTLTSHLSPVVADGEQPVIVAVEPMSDMIVCPPAARLPEGADIGDAEFGAMPVDTETTMAAGAVGASLATASWEFFGGAAIQLEPGLDAMAMRIRHEGSQPATLTTPPAAGSQFAAAAALASVTTAGDLRGLAAASCFESSLSQWLLGGQTTIGASSMLTVANPGPTAAMVTIQAFGADGPITLGGQGQFPVASGQAASVRLEAVAPGQELIAVHVVATGSPVAASLQIHRLAGLTPLGVDLLPAQAAPTNSQVIVGLESDGAASPDGPRLRLISPSAPATVTLRAVGEFATIELAEGTVALEPGVVVEIPLEGLPHGAFSVLVESDEPVLASASMYRAMTPSGEAVTPGTPMDIAVIPGQPMPRPGVTSLIAVPADVSASLAVVAPVADIPVDVTLHAFDEHGALLTSATVTIVQDSTLRMRLEDLIGPESAAQAALLQMDVPDHAQIVWGLGLAAADGLANQGSLISWIGPRAGVQDPGHVIVREGPAVVG